MLQLASAIIASGCAMEEDAGRADGGLSSNATHGGKGQVVCWTDGVNASRVCACPTGERASTAAPAQCRRRLTALSSFLLHVSFTPTENPSTIRVVPETHTCTSPPNSLPVDEGILRELAVIKRRNPNVHVRAEVVMSMQPQPQQKPHRRRAAKGSIPPIPAETQTHKKLSFPQSRCTTAK